MCAKPCCLASSQTVHKVSIGDQDGNENIQVRCFWTTAPSTCQAKLGIYVEPWFSHSTKEPLSTTYVGTNWCWHTKKTRNGALTLMKNTFLRTPIFAIHSIDQYPWVHDSGQCFVCSIIDPRVNGSMGSQRSRLQMVPEIRQDLKDCGYDDVGML